MRKSLLIICLILLSLNGYSQQYFTRRQVYNFTVGDLFESRMGNTGNGRFTEYLTVILSKSYSAGGDTLYYSDSLYGYVPKSCMTCTDSSFFSRIESDTIKNLDSAMLWPDTANVSYSKYYICHDIDTIEPYCSTMEFISQPDYSCPGLDSCDYYNMWFGPSTNYLYKGVPDVFYDMSDYTCGCTDYYYFQYFKKNDTTCGFYDNIRFHPLGITNISAPLFTLTLYPNPATSQLYMSSNTTFYKYDITDIAGRLLLSSDYSNNTPINIETLPAGQYLVKFYSKNSGYVVKQFLKE